LTYPEFEGEAALVECEQLAWVDRETTVDFGSSDDLQAYMEAIAVEAAKANDAAHAELPRECATYFRAW
jgi:hypothetical protein